MDELYCQVHELFNIYHDPGHDEKHALRVSKIAKKIAIAEKYDPLKAEIAGLLHDIGRTVINRKIPHADAGFIVARDLLDQYTNLLGDAKLEILSAIKHHSDLRTTGRLNNILQDADKIDGMGALGINRAYSSTTPDYDSKNIIPGAGIYGKFKNAHELIGLEMEWYGMLYTKTAKKIAEPRYKFTLQFMEEIKREIEESS